MSGAEFDDDVTVDVDEALLARIRADAARRAAGLGDDEVSGGVDASPEGTDEATRGIEDEVLESIGGGESEEDVPTIEGYGALREIGRGGFSRVYEALQFEFQRWVAIKVLTERLESAEEIADFERECRLTGVLSRHPNIVTVLASALTEEQRPCIVMELFPHGSYLNILKRTGPLGLEDLLSLAVRISGALATAHRQGMVHGDVKPQNIFRSEFGSAALGDFGIATLMHQRTEAAKTRLSLYYAAPELVDSGVSATSPFADQYSLAATIYTLATGLRPFESEAGDTTGQLLARMLSEPAPRLGEEFPASLDDALSQAMAREPQHRHRDVVAFAAAIAKVEQELGLRPTEIPLVRDSGRYVGETPGSDRPRPTTGSRSQDTPTTPPSAAHPQQPLASSRELAASSEYTPDAVSQTVVRPIVPVDTGTQAPEPEQPDEKPRIPMWAKIGSAVAVIAAAVAIVVVVTTGDGEDVDDSVAPPATSAVDSDPEQLDPEQPDSEQPDSELPDSELPDLELLDFELPDFELPPDFEQPDLDPPDRPTGGSADRGTGADESGEGSEGFGGEDDVDVVGGSEGSGGEDDVGATLEEGPDGPYRAAFVSQFLGKYQIFYIDFVINDDVDVSATQPVISDEWELGHPSISPDGSWIAYSRRSGPSASDSDDPDSWEIFVRNIDTSQELQLVCKDNTDTISVKNTEVRVPNNGWSPNWSRDGQLVAFSYGSAGNDIWTVNVETGEYNRVKDTRSKDDAFVSFSPDDSWIVFARRNYPHIMPNPRGIWILNLGITDVPVWLTRNHPKGDYNTPDWSPESDMIAYSVSLQDSNFRHIGVMDEQGNLLVLLTEGRVHDTAPSWSTDGRWIAFTRSEVDDNGKPGNGDIYVVEAGGGDAPKTVYASADHDYSDPSLVSSEVSSGDVVVNPVFDCRTS